VRILVTCLQAQKKHPLIGYEHWRRYFIEGCREAGLEPVEIPGVDWVEAFTLSGQELAAWRSRTWEAALAFVRKEHASAGLSLFLSYFYPIHIEENAIQEIRRIGVPCVNFFCDNVRLYRKIPREYLPFDLHWVPEFEALSLYQSARLPSIHAPMPCWIPGDLRQLPTAETEPPTFIGGRDDLRAELLGRAIALGGKFRIRGHGWKNGDRKAHPRGPYLQVLRNQVALVEQWGLMSLFYKIEQRLNARGLIRIRDSDLPGPVGGHDYFRVTQEAEVTIGVNRESRPDTSDRRPLTYSRLRDIEAPMLGACYLSEWTEGLERLYDLGTEIETYRTAEELVAKLEMLARDHAKRHSLRRLGQERALTDHSVCRTLSKITDRLGIS
jgi:Glycosyl transferases group 1